MKLCFWSSTSHDIAHVNSVRRFGCNNHRNNQNDREERNLHESSVLAESLKPPENPARSHKSWERQSWSVSGPSCRSGLRLDIPGRWSRTQDRQIKNRIR